MEKEIGAPTHNVEVVQKKGRVSIGINRTSIEDKDFQRASHKKKSPFKNKKFEIKSSKPAKNCSNSHGEESSIANEVNQKEQKLQKVVSQKSGLEKESISNIQSEKSAKDSESDFKDD